MFMKQEVTRTFAVYITFVKPKTEVGNTISDHESSGFALETGYKEG